MKLFANRKIKILFYEILVSVIVFIFVSFVFIKWADKNAALYVCICALCMTAAILLFLYWYFKEQHKTLETVAEQITEYIAGNDKARIECNEEGELYRLFHEVNSLVAILNAHAEHEMRSKEFLKNTIADISHQLKTPLAALNIYNGIMQDEAKNQPTIQEFATLSEQELDRIETLVQNLLKITKLDAGTMVIDKNVENVCEMMECVQRHFSFRSEQEKKKIQLIGDDSINMLCDRDWLIEAVDNIVKNALDHTEKGDKIQIEWKQFASVIQIVIKDNGSGIHPEDLHHIFKRFYRSRFSKDTQGVGLGLSLAKAIIEIHNGTIEVDSALNIGTTFAINFLVPTKL